MRHCKRIWASISVFAVTKATAIPTPYLRRCRYIIRIHNNDFSQYAVIVIDVADITTVCTCNLRGGVINGVMQIFTANAAHLLKDACLFRSEAVRRSITISLYGFTNGRDSCIIIDSEVDVCQRSNMSRTALVRKCNPVHRPQIRCSNYGRSKRAIGIIMNNFIYAVKNNLRGFCAYKRITRQVKGIGISTGNIQSLIFVNVSEYNTCNLYVILVQITVKPVCGCRSIPSIVVIPRKTQFSIPIYPRIRCHNSSAPLDKIAEGNNALQNRHGCNSDIMSGQCRQISLQWYTANKTSLFNKTLYSCWERQLRAEIERIKLIISHDVAVIISPRQQSVLDNIKLCHPVQRFKADSAQTTRLFIRRKITAWNPINSIAYIKLNLFAVIGRNCLVGICSPINRGSAPINNADFNE